MMSGQKIIDGLGDAISEERATPERIWVTASGNGNGDHGLYGVVHVFPCDVQCIRFDIHAQTLAAVEDPEAKQLLAILLLGSRIHAWSDKPVGAFHSETAEDALLSEIAIAFRVTRAAIDDTIVELLRLYGLREAHS